MSSPNHKWMLGIVLASVAGCAGPGKPAGSQHGADGPATGFGRPAILARNEGERRMLQGRKPLFIKVDPQTLGSRTLTVGLEDVPPGDSLGQHKHLAQDEVLFVHRGRVEVTLGDSTRRAETGATVFVPRGTKIGLRVVGADTATIFFVFNAPGFEKCLRVLSAPVGTPFVRPPDSVISATRRECNTVRRVGEPQ